MAFVVRKPGQDDLSEEELRGYVEEMASKQPQIHKYSVEIALPTESNIYDVVEKGLKEHANKKVLINGVTQESLTGQKILDLTTQLSNGLRKRGFQKGDTLCICLQNDLYYPVLLLAAFRNGGIATTANPGLTADELKKQLRDSRPKFLFYSDVSATAAQEALKELDFIEESFHVMKSADSTTAVKDLLKDLDFIQESFLVMKSADGRHQFDALFQEGTEGSGETSLADYVDSLPVAVGQSDIAVLPYSSGTTGLPKGVQLSHRSIVFAIAANKHPEILGLKADDVALAFLPFFHIFGCVFLLTYLSGGCTQVLMPKFNFGQFLTIIQEFKVTSLPIVPPIAVALVQQPIVRKFDLSSIKLVIVGAAPLSEVLESKLGEIIPGADICHGYGLTEAPMGTHVTPKGRNKPGSCGTVGPFYESKVVDDSGNLLPAGEHGNICVRGPQTMSGYLGCPGETAAILDKDGWLYTGDIGYYDEEGFYFIVDRAKELIKWKGFQVAPAELESLLLQHPKVLDVAVVGLPDERAGELPMAFVVKKPGHDDLSEEELRGYVEAHAADHKRLRGGVRFVDAIPKSESGKILRRILKKQLLDSLKGESSN
ncbi:unnamed protein product [Cyprideis torosa]|uniref:Luciferin 4-monooxygenase n=1 Tax=Cyprideis torosa TaxID=163714 RepID=A0A7R8W6J0_9CRUS|nr:unnamed protein product [Cyprideis torosa]CAG0886496.1 unnamed protein product [Cyprideis torosa]